MDILYTLKHQMAASARSAVLHQYFLTDQVLSFPTATELDCQNWKGTEIWMFFDNAHT